MLQIIFLQFQLLISSTMFLIKYKLDRTTIITDSDINNQAFYALMIKL